MWIISTFWLLKHHASISITYKFLSEHECSVLWDIHLEGKCLDHIVIPCFNFWGIAKLFHGCYTTVHFYQQYLKGPISPHSFQHWSVFFITVILVGVNYVIVIFIFMAPPMAYGSSQARDRFQATAVTMQDPLTHCARLGLNLCLHSISTCCSWVLKPLKHIRNSFVTVILICIFLMTRDVEHLFMAKDLPFLLGCFYLH